MHYSKAEDMLLVAWLCMPMCICRGMEMLVWGVSGEPHTSRIPPIRDRCHLCACVTQEQLPQPCSAWGKAELMPAGEHKAGTHSHSPH